ncbi:MAG: dipeptidase [Devosia sp.]|uniref:dipeptidase n=1 Tax=Devosia sp. TaxID=1871048 RepID=UPI002615783D|nr:dipeptidase [Devosia sp.]MDB5585368.1 dipeptidase [Devosia sp.]
MSEIETYLADQEAEALADVIAFCRIPSVSTDPAFAEGISAAAEFVAERMRKAGFPKVEIVPTGGHPTVIAEWCETPGAPTLLVYGHYDVQPPDPLDKWLTPPFEPTIRNDRLYARGVSDDKAPLLLPIIVAEAFGKLSGGLPINLKMLIEGEEESGSPHFEPTVERLKDRLACDLVVSADGAMWRPDIASVTVATRGLVALDVVVHGAGKDLHSGRHGGSAPNAIRVLTHLMASLHDAECNVAVEGFADGALPPDPAIIEAIKAIGFDSGAYFDEIGARRPATLPTGEELLTRQWLVPTLEFNGISGGYAGPGTKTVIPAQASAKITCRLVAGQDPMAVIAAIEAHLMAHLPSGYELDVHGHGPGTTAFALDPDLPALKISEDIFGEVLGQKPLRVAMGATIPIGAVMKKHLGVGMIFFSFSTSDEDYHAPNEFFRLANLRIGLTAWARLIERLGAQG